MTAATRALLVMGGALFVSMATVSATPKGLSPKEELGKSIFFDTNLSANDNQACASCHDPKTGFTSPKARTNAHGAVQQGSFAGRFGGRKPPTAAYATISPVLHIDEEGLFIGGNFWDGRATGARLGSPSAEQSQMPFLNPVEQALGSPADVVGRVCGGPYGRLFMKVWGTRICSNVNKAYDAIALSIAAYEDSDEVNAFDSRFDRARGGHRLARLEEKGREIFEGKANCAACHPSDGRKPLFTDFSYDNIGIPKNPENPANVADPSFVDAGLGGALQIAGQPSSVYDAEWSKFKVSTLRNVDARPYPGFVKAFGHNGFFKSLEGIVHFYNTRDVLPRCPEPGGVPFTEAQALAGGCWPAPEYEPTMNVDELGNLGLSGFEEQALVAFLRTLTDIDEHGHY